MHDREPQTDMQDLYRELILDHSRSPRHFGRLENATHTADGINPLCGDKLKTVPASRRDGSIESTCFEGSGCAISVASASLMTDTVTGLKSTRPIRSSNEVTQRLTRMNRSQVDIELRQARGTRWRACISVARQMRNACLARTALCIENETTPATTE